MARIPQPNLNLDQAKVALQEVLDAFSTQENRVLVNQIKEDAGNDTVKLVQLFIPLAAQIQQDVIKNYGFTADGEGILCFTHIVKAFEDKDEQIQQMLQELKSKFIPLLPKPPLIMKTNPEN